ncbi:cytochrome c4 [Mariprofundus erugo]|uniref:Cytochrome c4 n=1 Tax=Mariprofundus erugo TaxID=2528639 RepID=A0A5R9GNH9_9PROT|nr:c-type cytochrome [Mariprofundus erugo]TLS67916.1 cytochrome c4 [Mariprofundus erugo]TLS76679.1 cytochrome c4 [Mariprofundus erugo]
MKRMTQMIAGAMVLLPASMAYADAEKKLQVCSGCHGVETSSAPDIPNLAGQNAEYIFNQVKNFKAGTRKDFTMSLMVEAISDDDIKVVAAHYATITPAANTFDKALAAKGKEIFTSVCFACHGDKGLGGENIARIATQKSAYLIKQLKAFKSGARDNETMRDVASKLSEDQMKAVAEYESSL